LGEAVRAADPTYLAAGSLIVLTFPFLNAARWLAVLRSQRIAMTYARCVRISLAVWPVGTLTPAKAGEFLKAAALRGEAPMDQVLGTALSERVIDVGVLGAFALAGGLAASQPAASLVGAGALLAAIATAPILSLVARALERGTRLPMASKLRALIAVFPALLRQPLHLAGCVAASATNWFLSIIQLWLLLRAFGSAVGFGALVGALPAATFAGLLPITIAGAGTRDAALLALVGEDPARLLAAGIVYTLTGYFGLGILGLPFLKELRGSNPPAPTEAAIR
jgi:uncharacterized membrane protein YbhN (UPF0104 family)